VHGRERRLKDVNAFEEEGALLLEEDGEALVGRDDGRVGLDLREVRVERHVERHRRRDADLGRQARVEIHRPVEEAPAVGAELVALRLGEGALRRHEGRHAAALLRDGQRGDDLDGALGRDAFEPRDVPPLPEQA
jgi:hypothetical protein